MWMTLLSLALMDDIEHLKSHLHHQFSIKDLGRLNYFLGIEVGYTSEGILLSQNKFTKELLSGCDVDLSRKASTPLPLNLKLQADLGDLLLAADTYRSLVGKLNFLTTTRPDLAYAVQSLSRFIHAPRTSHFASLVHTLRYVSRMEAKGFY